MKISTQEQVNAINFLYNNNERIRDEILTNLLQELPEIKEIYEDLVPEINKIDDLKNVLGLSIVHIMESDKEGFAYVGYELGCNWDDEHRIGIMTHKNKVIEIGQADVSFNSWITYKEKGLTKQEEQQWNNENKVSVQQDKARVKKL